MELYIFNKNIELLGIIEDFNSLIWNRKYHKCGTFELHLPINNYNLNLIKLGNILYKSGDNEAVYIENIFYDDQKELIVRGKFIIGYLNRRIIWDTFIYNGNAVNAMVNLVDSNCINPIDTTRKIPLLEVAENVNTEKTISFQDTGSNLLEKLEDISNVTNLGYKILFDYKNKKLKFKIYEGKKVSMIFSKEFENVISMEYLQDISDYKNTTLIAGAGEGKDRKKISIVEGQGLDRYELYVDARDLQNTKYVNEVEVPIPDSEYYPMLTNRGQEKLQENKKLETFESEIILEGYKKDFDLGDIITIFGKNLKIETRITEITEIYENGYMKLVPTFGNSIPTILEKVGK